jgi:colanic acid/amylovoran biosynthesis glycosyltransferase
MGNKEKILAYNDGFFKISQTFMYYQVKSLAEKFDVHLLANKYENPHGFNDDMFIKHKINKPGNFTGKLTSKVVRLKHNSSLNVDLKSYLLLKKLLKKEKYKAIHAHFGPRALDILALAKKYRIPLVVSFHGYDASQQVKNKSYADRLPELFDYASAIIIVSGHMKETLKLDPWIEKVHLIPYGINPDEFNSQKRKTNSDNIRILHSGRIVGKKGVPDLIKVFSELNKKYGNLDLHIIGDGNELDQCKKLVDELGIQGTVTFYGAVSHDIVKTLLNEADIFVLNSRIDENGDMEGTPVTILEAMYMGNAVVSTRHAGIPYVIEHGKNGLLADEYNNDELKKCIQSLIGDPQLRSRLGQAAKKRIIESHTTSVMQKNLLQVFDSI